MATSSEQQASEPASEQASGAASEPASGESSDQASEQCMQPLTPAWDGGGEPVSVVLTTSKDQAGIGTVYVETFAQSHRVRRAVFVLLMFWVFAAFSVFIPMAHFLLVPGFFIAGPVLASRRLNEASMIRGGVLKCPGCDRRLRVHEQADQWPLGLSCNGCWVTVEASKAA